MMPDRWRAYTHRLYVHTSMKRIIYTDQYDFCIMVDYQIMSMSSLRLVEEKMRGPAQEMWIKLQVKIPCT